MSLFSPKNSFFIFLVLTAGASVSFLDQTILPVALPTIQKEIDISTNAVFWSVNLYLLATALFFIVGGKLSDSAGHKLGFLLGTSSFGVASILCGLANGAFVLLLGRFLQGVAAALIFPSVTAIVLDTFPSHSKGKAMGLLMGVSSFFLLLGPFVGGILAEFVSWRAIFFINVPLVAFAFFGALVSIQGKKGPKETFDIYGFMLFCLSLLCIVYPLMQVHIWGWSSGKFWILLLAAVAFISMMIVLEKRTQHPFIDRTLFSSRKFSGALLIAFATQTILSLPVFWPIFMQHVLKLSPSFTGFLSLLSILPVIICSPLAGRLADTYGSYTPAKYGFIALGICLFWSIFAFPTYNVPLIVVGMTFLGIGITLVSSSTGIYGISSVSDHRKGVASGMYSTTRNMGITLGVAVMSTLIATFQMFFFKVNLQYHSDTAQLSAKKLVSLYAGNEETMAYFSSLDPNTQHHISESLRSATAYAYSIGMLVLFVAVILGFSALKNFFRNMEKNTPVK